MTAKHTDPEWRRTVRTVRAQVKLARQRGEEVTCWRCGYPIDAEQQYDVGHITREGGNGIDNAAPEHRTRTGTCLGNRNHGGRIGARITNTRRAARAGTFTPPKWARITASFLSSTTTATPAYGSTRATLPTWEAV